MIFILILYVPLSILLILFQTFEEIRDENLIKVTFVKETVTLTSCKD